MTSDLRNEMRQAGVGLTILNQLGGVRFMVMTGARDVLVGNREVQFGIRAGRINKVRIELTPRDTYKVEFYRIAQRGLKVDVIASFDDVYCDTLREVFERTTGLYTSL